MLDTNVKIDLLNTDPYFAATIHGGPDYEDDFLAYKLGQDYSNYEAMRRDGHVSSRLQARKFAILGRRLLVKPFKKEKLADRKNAEIASEILRQINYEQICSDLFDSGSLMGFSALSLEFYEKDGYLLPKTEFINQRRIGFSYYYPDEYDLPVATGETLDRSLPVNEQIAMKNGYEVRLLTRRNPNRGERVPKGKIVVFTFGSSQGSPWGRGLGYQFWPLTEIKRQARIAWLLHSDRLGTPPVAGEYPDLNLNRPDQKAALEAFKRFLRAVSPNGWGAFPAGFTAKLLEGTSNSVEFHKALIKLCNDEISEAALLEVSYEEKSNGSLAAKVSQSENRESGLTDADCNLLDAQLQEQFWPVILELNSSRGNCPIIKRWTTEDAREIEDNNLEADTLDKLADVVTKMKAAGFEPGDDWINRRFGSDWIYVRNAVDQQSDTENEPEDVDGQTDTEE
jgi:phage gp29-like protein